ncbi:MAG: thioredoxin-dependent thiol peroxidase [Chitinophagales bacterium]
MSITHLKIGDTAPNFEGIDQDNQPIKLKDFQGKKVILFFYPKDNTPTCTVEACNFRDNQEMLTKEGYVTIGVSPDGSKSHIKFRTKHNLPFPLIADTDKSILNLYGVWGEKKFMGRIYDGVHRTTFVIDENGIISQVIKKVKSKIHTQQILDLEAV